ncbi:cytidylyltransferase domain-containing protein [Teredinibacter turnerae]|uniref:acylneuraminate cytidylyltransferase family protein n=1 Tax=Teredinibacter turnerae TaxID=2426 RepID=UPI00036BEC28|nr:acylneuraminate cytidylyltransferase family protein [Teredinibacter turnerae]
MSTHSVLALIPARAGSKGLPGKNVRPLAGKPLVCHTIEQALAARCVTTTVLSSDDQSLLNHTNSYAQCKALLRPEALASDESPMTLVAMHALEQFPDYRYLLLLQPTSPLRTSADIDKAFDLLTQNNATSCVSVCTTQESPFWMYLQDEQHRLEPIIGTDTFTRRQDLPKTFRLNGALYLIDTAQFKKAPVFVQPDTLAYEMPVERSIDIDTLDGFTRCEKWLQQTGAQQ